MFPHFDWPSNSCCAVSDVLSLSFPCSSQCRIPPYRPNGTRSANGLFQPNHQLKLNCCFLLFLSPTFYLGHFLLCYCISLFCNSLMPDVRLLLVASQYTPGECGESIYRFDTDTDPDPCKKGFSVPCKSSILCLNWPMWPPTCAGVCCLWIYSIYVQYSIASAISLLNCLEWPKIPHSSGYLANYCQLFFRCYFCVHFIPPLIVTGFC